MATLTNGFITPALECLSLRSGGLNRTAIYVVLSAMGSLPETILSVVGALKSNSTPNHLLPVETIIGCGWISMTVIPALVSMKRKTEIHFVILLREIGAYVSMCGLLLFNLTDWSSSLILYSSMLLGLYLIYFKIVRATQFIDKRMVRLQRETRLIFQLQPIGMCVHDGDQLERAPIELALNRPGCLNDLSFNGLTELIPGKPNTGEPESDPKECVRDTHGSENSMSVRIMSWFCFRALPGTASERFYMLAVMNALLLHILLSALVATICNSWTTQLLPGLSGRLIGPIIVAGFSLVGEALKISNISTAGDASHFIVGGLSAQVFSFGAGLGLPWLISGFTGGNCVLNFPTIKNQLSLSMVCACILMIYCIANLDNAKTVHFHHGRWLLLVYFIVALVFIFSQ